MASLPKEPFTLTGGCLCQAIRYSLSIPAYHSRPARVNTEARGLVISVDHCQSCRLATGGLVQGWFICPTTWISFSLLRREAPGERLTLDDAMEALKGGKDVVEQTFLSHYASSEEIHRTFCGRCGTSLTYFWEGQQEQEWGYKFDIGLGTLDSESLEVQGVRPETQFWWDDGVSWVKTLTKHGDGGLLTQNGDGSIVEDA